MTKLIALNPDQSAEICATLIKWTKDQAEALLWAGPKLNWPLEIHALAAFLDFEANQHFGLYQNGQMVGFYQVSKITPFCFHFGKIIIAPKMRGKGLAKKMVEQAIMQAKEDGALQITLNVLEENDVAIKLYTHLGFEQMAFIRPNRIKMNYRF